MGNQSSSISRNTQEDFDPQRYTGKWYEAARYPIVWERDCYSAEANYEWDGQKLLVENVCVGPDLNPRRARHGEARVENTHNKSVLKLKFTDGLPAGPESDYVVFATDYNNYSIVGDFTGRYLWVLIRSPYLRRRDIPLINNKVQSFGFNPNQLIYAKNRIRE